MSWNVDATLLRRLLNVKWRGEQEANGARPSSYRETLVLNQCVSFRCEDETVAALKQRKQRTTTISHICSEWRLLIDSMLSCYLTERYWQSQNVIKKKVQRNAFLRNRSLNEIGIHAWKFGIFRGKIEKFSILRSAGYWFIISADFSPLENGETFEINAIGSDQLWLASSTRNNGIRFERAEYSSLQEEHGQRKLCRVLWDLGAYSRTRSVLLRDRVRSSGKHRNEMRKRMRRTEGNDEIETE